MPPSRWPLPAPGWRLYLAMTRPGFLVVTLVGCVLGWATSAACGLPFSPAKALSTLVLALLAHAGANVLNDYHDAVNGADAANHHGLYPFSGGSRLIQQGLVSVPETRLWAWALLGVVVPGGLLLAVYSGGGLVLIGLAGLVLAWAYSAPPLKLMSRGVGELAIAGAWWLVVVGADYVQRGHWFIIPAFVAASYALLVANILLVNGLPDAQADAQVGKRTLATRLTGRQVAAVYTVLVLLAHGGLAWGVWALIPPYSALWGLVSLPLGLVAAGLLWQRANTPQKLRPVAVLSIACACVHGLALSAGLWMVRG